MDNYKAAIEAILFVSEKPVSPQQIKPVFQDLEISRIKELILELKGDYEKASGGLRIEEVAGAFQMVTSLGIAAFLKEYFKQRDSQRLSIPALETLSIVAYKQPLTRLDIESLRGVNVDGVIKSLLEKNLIRITGKKDIPGKPFVYGTTRQFLEYFGLNSLEELPKMEEFTKTSSQAGTLLSLSNRTAEFIEGDKKSEPEKPEKTD